MMFGWSGDNGDPDNFFVPLLGCEAVKGGGNVARWCNKPFEDLIIKAAQTPKQADRAKLYEQAQVIVKEEAPWITHRALGALRPAAQGSDGLQDGRDRAPLLQGCDLEQVARQLCTLAHGSVTPDSEHYNKTCSKK